jgi:hypothetical protein
MTQAWETGTTSCRGRRADHSFGSPTRRSPRNGKEGLRGDGRPPVGTLPRIVHPSSTNFQGRWYASKPLMEDTKAGKWELLNAGMRRYGMSKTLTVMFMYAQPASRNPVVACLITGSTNSNTASPPTLLFRTSHSYVSTGDMDTGLTRDAAFFIQVLVKWIIPMLVPVPVLLRPDGFLRISAKSARDLLQASSDEKMLEKHPKALYLEVGENEQITLKREVYDIRALKRTKPC